MTGAPSAWEALTRAHAAGWDTPAETPLPVAVTTTTGAPLLPPVNGGWTLAAALRATRALPAWPTAAMDGFAVSDGPGPWTVSRAILAGDPPGAPLRPGCAAQVATGSAVPDGTAAVLRVEHARTLTGGALPRGAPPLPAGSRITAEAPPAVGTDLRPAGGEALAGDELAAAGAPLTAALRGLAAAAGLDTVAARPPAPVRLVVSGAELLLTGAPADGRIRDALGPALPALLQAAGGALLSLTVVGDSAAETDTALRAGGERLLVTTGATAHGPADQLRPALRRAGATVLVPEVAVRPGHPMLLARLPDGRLVTGLPGNPLAALAAVVLLVVPALAGLARRPPPPARWLLWRDSAPDDPGRGDRLVPVRDRGGVAEPCRPAGSGMLRGAASADGLALLGGAGPQPDPALAALPLPAGVRWVPVLALPG